MDRKAGLLFPISALPSRYGVGDFGKEAFQLIDMMKQASIRIWQILPLNPLGYGNSPYQPLSSHAGDEIYISLDLLCEEGLLDLKDIKKFDNMCEHVNYQAIRKLKDTLFLKAFNRFNKSDEFMEFVNSQEWIFDYAIFRVFKKNQEDKPWTEWNDEYKYFDSNNLKFLEQFQDEIDYQLFLQFYFFKQWNALREYAHKNNIKIIGDMPIYVGLDSDDVWKNQKCFLLNQDGKPTFVAGVPPDYFSKFGQRWGNPLYNWEYLKQHQFYFWVNRMRAATSLYDVVRIDHFRAFDTYWKIPERESTAVVGEWVEAPGYDLFDTLYQEIPHLSLLAEDLGELRQEVYDLRDYYHLKGMYVFQFHYNQFFDFNKVVVYTGTHDNDTLVGWLESLPQDEYEKIQKFLEIYQEKEDYQKIIHYCLDTKANEVIIPVWDIMGCGTQSRFNVPGKIGSPNWEYHLPSFDDFESYLVIYQNMIESSHRKGE